MRVVVVGAGSSGCVVAARCAAVPGVEVVLVEAGPDRRRALPVDRLPIGPGSDLIDPIEVRIDGDAAVVTRGRVLGGSGAINGGYFVRGRVADFVGWPQPEWSIAEITAAYRRAEHDLDFPDSSDHGGTSDHGGAGPIPVQRVRPDRYAAATRAAVPAFDRAGLPAVADLNDMSIDTGYGAVPGNVRDGFRIDSATAYFGNGSNEITAPGAVRLRTGCTALSVLVDRGRARGVRVRTAAGRIEDVGADLVVLSAGAVRTPQLLLLSGIGAAADLRRLGRDVVVDLPGVGHGVRDHPEVLLPTDDRVGNRPDRLLEVVGHLDGFEIRPYTAGFGAFIPGIDAGAGDVRYVGIALMHSATVGTVRLDPADPTAPPRVEYDLREDRPRLDAALGYRDLAALVGQLGVPTAAVGRIGMSLHASCSARMGDDPAAVVDARCRVFGVDGLRVIDTSAFPRIPTRGPHATAIMFAERAADLLLDDMGDKSATVE